MPSLWEAQQEQLAAAGKLFTVSAERQKEIKKELKAVQDEYKKNKPKVTEEEQAAALLYHPMNRVHLPYGVK
eukprot:CAMPEP_0197853646 /NCGR_PEP_ID=MMETSP1438-20131217/23105_1 /TAXON_ID=1461541 /ORGANISM="Pterosperma sp., Strain CCMP1384" /LENGTH=71 /DNA_ID=CAMNT_0043468123 /DNA_START=193 /DNA_END=408 /DNA_ORIENTATION=+